MFVKDKIGSAQVSSRKKTKEGYLDVPAKLSKVGVCEYLDKELGVGDAGEIKKVARTEKSLFTDETISSFEGAPLTLRHSDESVTAENWKKYAVGFVKNVRREGDFLVADARITDAETIKNIEEFGVEELSCGYEADITATTINDSDYEFSAMIGNHVALVARGRCGRTCKLADEDLKPMSKTKKALLAMLAIFGIKPTDEQLKAVEDLEVDEAEAKATDKPEDKQPETPVNTPEETKTEPTPAPTKEDTAEMVDKEKYAKLEAENKALKEQIDQAAAKVKRDQALLEVQAIDKGFTVRDTDTVREIQEQFVIKAGIKDAETVKKINDAELAGMFEAAKVISQKLASKNLGKTLIGDSVEEDQPAVIDYNKLYGEEQ